jgi:geranylgeranyl reductase family protein
MYDIIIIGAGPSGSSCAYNIKRFNPAATVLLIDKAQFPRYKPCGGGISPEVKNYLDFDFQSAVSCNSRHILLTANKQSVRAQCDMHMVRREHFDDFLVSKARDRHVEILMNCEVIDIEKLTSHLIVKTMNGDYAGKIVVLAEGSSGKLARKLNMGADNSVAAALEYEHADNNPSNLLHIDFDHNKSGYAWVFPKSDGLSMGIGRFSKQKRAKENGLQQQLKSYLGMHNVTEIIRERLHGHPVQLYSGKKKLVHDRIVLIGEIAGCVDPLTAEGIRPAIKSGFLAAKILAEAIAKNKITIIKKYDRVFHKEIGKDFQYARFASYLLFRYYEKVLPLFCTPRAVNAFANVFTGRERYADHLSLKKALRLLMRVFKRKNIFSLNQKQL